MTILKVTLLPLLLVSLAMCAGCAGITSKMDPPVIDLVSVRNIPVQGEAPKFEIKLRVMNPNTQTLDIAGISYTIAFLGKELVTGVANDIAPIEGYGEGTVTLEARLQLLELLRLMASLGSKGSEPLAYRFTAKIDFNGLTPTQRIDETGEIVLN